MSDYFKNLDPAASNRYLAKLRILGLGTNDDPFAASNAANFVDDMKLWPHVEYPHIYCYFIERPGVYTREQLKQWKSLDGFNYFQSGHVRQVGVWRVDKNRLCILKAFVNPSQRSPKMAHQSWVAVRSDGDIVTAHCTCMAG